MKRRRLTTLALAVAFALAAANASPAAAASPAPHFLISTVAQPTNFPLTSGGGGEPTDRYLLVLTNTGAAASTGTITLTDHLPAGVAITEGHVGGPHGSGWSCSSDESGTVLTCTYAAAVPPLRQTSILTIPITVATAGTLTNQLALSGGGAPLVTASLTSEAGSPLGPWGFLQFFDQTTDRSGAADTQAADHPQALSNAFDFPVHVNPEGPPEDPGTHAVHPLKAIKFTLPPGLIGNPQATPRCSIVDVQSKACPLASRVGTMLVNFTGTLASGTYTIYNVTPEHGYAAEFGAFIEGVDKAVFIYAKVGPAPDYRIQVTVPLVLSVGDVSSTIVTFYGDPATANGEPTPSAFLTNPSDCSHGPFTTESEAESWEEQGQWALASASMPGVSGCNQLSFAPTIEALPTTNVADSPAGLEFNLRVPQGEDPEGLATPPLKDATVTLPSGLAANPALADGLQSCSKAQIAIDTTQPASCPLASQIGTVQITTPLLAEPVGGQVFLGTPECSPCSEADAQQGRMLKLYIQAIQPETGIDVKIAGIARANPATGQLSASFEDNPQFPFSELNLHFKQGPRAPLRTPSTCGGYQTTSELRPWSAPETPEATPSSSFAIASRPGGAPCVTDPAKAPLKPGFSAGTLDPVAGAFSPFTMKLTRSDGEQGLSGLEVSTPPGIAADLRGVPYCPEAALAAAAKSSGHDELSSPSCPAASQVGTATVGAGAGPSPYHVAAKVYLAGPYKGAPVSLAVITPALAGPFDLGTVVVRAAAHVDPTDAHLHVISDPLPRVLDGIPLDLRDIRVAVDRPHFTTNPTYCEPMSVFADVFGDAGAASRVSNPFQVGGCKGLGFKPKLSLKLKGGTKRGDHPAFSATLEARRGDANIGRAQVALPHAEFLDQAHIKTICTRVQFAAKACPAGSVYGFAKATSPLLDAPLEGPVYLRSSNHSLPDLVVALSGQVDVELDGRVDSVNGGLRNTFEVVPDAPVSKFTLSMQGGKKGLLENSTDLCAQTQRATVTLTGQNNKTLQTQPKLLAQGCAKAKHDKRGAHRRQHHG